MLGNPYHAKNPHVPAVPAAVAPWQFLIPLAALPVAGHGGITPLEHTGTDRVGPRTGAVRTTAGAS